MDHNDPKLTALVLGELPEDDVKELQAKIAADPELQREVDAIRQTVSQLETFLQEEPLPHLAGTPRPPAQVDQPQPKKRRFYHSTLVQFFVVFAMIGVLGGFMASGDKTGSRIPSIGCSASPELGIASIPVPTSQYRASQAEFAADKSKLADERSSSKKFAKIDKIETYKYVGDETFTEESNKAPAQKSGEGTTELHSYSGTRKLPTSEQQRRPAPSTEKPLNTPALICCDTFDVPTDGKPQSGTPSPRQRTVNGILEYTESIEGLNRDFRGETTKNSELAKSKEEKPNYTIVSGNNVTVGQSKPTDPFVIKDAVIGSDGVIVIAEEEESFTAEQKKRELPRRDAYDSPTNTRFSVFKENEFLKPQDAPFSTFSIDVDTASYSVARRYLMERNQLPPADAVRLEEFVNYFDYHDAPPTDGKPFATYVDVATCPWEKSHLLARVALKGKEIPKDDRPPLNLVFLVDVSGSMSGPNRLPLVQKALVELTENITEQDRVGIVTYAGNSRVALPSISGREKRAIVESIEGLSSGGSTAGAAGIKTAYELARKNFTKNGQNRVILCTDGDFNVGISDDSSLQRLIETESKSGVFLTVLGFGMGNHNDRMLKILADKGNGNYGYIDTIEEARKLLVEGLTGTLITIAKDVKIQVDFNPKRVAAYRLLGYENRKLRDEDFHNDKIDAGEIGAGHSVTALYEIVPVGGAIPGAVDKSRYADENDTVSRVGPRRAEVDANPGVAPSTASPPALLSDELMFVKLRFKAPDGEKSELLEKPVAAEAKSMSPDFEFAASVALFGMLLRDSRYSGDGNWSTVLELAKPFAESDKYRTEFVQLVEKAKTLKP